MDARRRFRSAKLQERAFAKRALLVIVLGFPYLAAGQGGRSTTASLQADYLSITQEHGVTRTRYRNFRLESDSVSVVASEAVATGDGLDANDWDLINEVRIVTSSAVLTGARAKLTFRNRELTTAVIEGTPASFTDNNPTHKQSRGAANKIVYDHPGRTLELITNASVSRGTIESGGCDLIYDFEKERLVSGPATCSESFRVRISRPAGAKKDNQQSQPAK
jgi:lipopolysaccharide transport protein LptA